MNNLKWIAVAALSSGLVLGVSAANAETVAANMGGCTHLAKEVRDAVDGNASSANLAEAQQEQGYGRDFCNNQLYDKGIMHYQHALELLGANKG
jgi:hypothetical protein